MLHFSNMLHFSKPRKIRANPTQANARTVLAAAVEALEERRLMAADPIGVRSFDGSGNNLAWSNWGSAGASYIRLARAEYTDGAASPSGANRASARAISNAVSAHPADDVLSERYLSAYAYAWGQFIDHDLDRTDSATPAEAFNVSVPKGDAYFDPASTGTKVIPLSRSNFTTDKNGQRQQTNSITGYIDASMVYGSDKARADALRTFSGGKLRTSAGDMLPYNTTGLDNDTFGGPASNWFVAGDKRVNENTELTVMQTLFLREHNRLAGEISQQNPRLSDEQVYQQARRLVIGEIQNITFNEFVPSLLGDDAMRRYTGYKPGVNAGISNEFATAAFRLGHSMLADDVEFLDNNGEEIREPVSLAEAFFNPSLVASTGVDPVLKYLASSNSEEIDPFVVGSLRNFLFGAPGSGGLDLVSLNIQRGRDHGLADYNSTRRAIGLPAVRSFADITDDKDVQASLKAAYGSVDNIDLWVGGLAEDHVRGASVGPTFSRILADQFTRSRDGDRFYFETDLKGRDLKFVSSVTLADVIQWNSGVENIQPDVFVFNAEITGRLFGDRNGDGKVQRGERGLGGRTVTLKDSTGAVIETAVTNRDGGYLFSGVPLGYVTVSTDLESTTGAAAQTVRVTKGERFSNVDFGNRPIVPPGGGAPLAAMTLPPVGAGARPTTPPPVRQNPVAGEQVNSDPTRPPRPGDATRPGLRLASQG